jgi:hypothetical protein
MYLPYTPHAPPLYLSCTCSAIGSFVIKNNRFPHITKKGSNELSAGIRARRFNKQLETVPALHPYRVHSYPVGL